MKDTLAIVAIAVCLFVGLFGVPSIPGVLPTPPLIEGEGLNVLMVWESDDPGAIPETQVQVLTSTIVSKWIREHNGDFRVFDDDIDLSVAPEKWRGAMKVERASLPWMIVSKQGEKNYSGPLPKTIDETLSVLETFE